MGRQNKEKIKLTDQEEKALAYWLKNPVEAVKDWFKATPDDWQGDALNAMFCGGKNRVAIKSCHGPGKTAFETWSGWIFLQCLTNSRVVATAPTMAQLNDILWPEYAKWHARMPNRMQSMWTISDTHIRSVIRPKLWFAVSRTSNKSANLQGFHGTDILIQCDEASGVPAEVFEVIEGALTEAGEEGKTAILQLAGNPNFTTGELFDAFTKNQGIYSRITVTGDRKVLKELSVEQGEDHRENGRVYYSPRVKEAYRSMMSRKYGDESAVYDVRVRGMFPRADDNAVVPLEWAQRAAGRELPNFDIVADPYTLVLDVARLGGNETVLGVFRRGIPVEPFEARAKTRTHVSADMVEEKKRQIEAAGGRVGMVIVDEPGVGGGVIDELEKRNIAVTPYNGGRGLVKGVDPDDECRMFTNRRDRDWWVVRRKLELNELPLPEDETLVAQLASLQYRYTDPGQKIKVESKQALCDRLGRKDASPDRADVIVMGCAPWYSLEGADNMAIESDDFDVESGMDRPEIEDWA